MFESLRDLAAVRKIYELETEPLRHAHDSKTPVRTFLKEELKIMRIAGAALIVGTAYLYHSVTEKRKAGKKRTAKSVVHDRTSNHASIYTKYY